MSGWGPSPPTYKLYHSSGQFAPLYEKKVLFFHFRPRKTKSQRSQRGKNKFSSHALFPLLSFFFFFDAFYCVHPLKWYKCIKSLVFFYICKYINFYFCAFCGVQVREGVPSQGTPDHRVFLPSCTSILKVALLIADKHACPEP